MRSYFKDSMLSDVLTHVIIPSTNDVRESYILIDMMSLWENHVQEKGYAFLMNLLDIRGNHGP